MYLLLNMQWGGLAVTALLDVQAGDNPSVIPSVLLPDELSTEFWRILFKE